jgi:DNA replication protein DnaC
MHPTPFSDREKQLIIYEKSQRWRHFLSARGTRYESCRFENFEILTPQMQSAINRLLRVASDPANRQNIILLGPPGSGKDHLLASCVYRRIAAVPTSVEWCSGPLLYSEMRSAIANKQSESNILAKYKNCEILVLSDVATQVLTDYQSELLYSIVDHRYNRERPNLAFRKFCEPKGI